MKTAFTLPVIGLLFSATQALAGASPVAIGQLSLPIPPVEWGGLQRLVSKAGGAQGWDAANSVEHPLELLGIPSISRAADMLLGDDRDDFVASLEGAGSGEVSDGFYIGSACTPNACTVAESFIVADIAGRQLYLAWKPEDEDIVVRPPVARWPNQARRALAEWAATWKQ